jgi:hypothetical protein
LFQVFRGNHNLIVAGLALPVHSIPDWIVLSGIVKRNFAYTAKASTFMLHEYEMRSAVIQLLKDIAC